MPPKRKADNNGDPPKKREKQEKKKQNVDDDYDDDSHLTLKMENADDSVAGGSRRQHKVHRVVKEKHSNAVIHEDFTCVLNQTDISKKNANKFYIIQLVTENGKYILCTVYGRVGEKGKETKHKQCISSDDAVKAFKKMFKDRTKNDWDKRAEFQHEAGSYDLIEIEEDVDDGVTRASEAGQQEDNSDWNKWPLGKLSKAQIQKGLGKLREIEQVLRDDKKGDLFMAFPIYFGSQDMSSQFYTMIPHASRRYELLPVLNADLVKEKRLSGKRT